MSMSLLAIVEMAGKPHRAVKDPLYRLTRADCTPASGTQTCPGPFAGTAGAPRSSLWSYDAVGNRLTAQTDSNATTSSYNEKNQLLGTTGGGKMVWRGSLDEPGTATFTSGTINGQPARMLAGNVFEAELNLPPGSNTVTIQAQDGSGNVATKNYSVNVTGSGATYTYDANGNLASKVEPNILGGTDTWTYTWNALNQLTGATKNAVGVASYQYDAKRRRISRAAGSSVTAWLYDGVDVVREEIADGGVSVKRFVHGKNIDEPLLSEEGGGSVFLHADALGSVSSRTNSSAIVDATSFDSWGSVDGEPSTYSFTGREWDAAVRLHFYRNRYYDPSIGRFIGQDPIRFMGGENFYSYVLDNPVRYGDAFGLQASEGCPTTPCPTQVGDMQTANGIPEACKIVQENEREFTPKVAKCINENCAAKAFSLRCTTQADCNRRFPGKRPSGYRHPDPGGNHLHICTKGYTSGSCEFKVTIVHEMQHACGQGTAGPPNDATEKFIDDNAARAAKCR